MNYTKRLDHAFKNAPILPIAKDSKYVFFSDCHRGIGTNNDNFLKNENIYLAALEYYYKQNYCYIEVGDGDELWENKSFDQIAEIHEKVFSLLTCFEKEKRCYLIYGNHDIVKRSYPNFYESIILRSENPDFDLLVIHGHQVDFLNSSLWMLSRFLVRHIWTPLKHFGILGPSSAAKNNIKCDKLTRKLLHYTEHRNCFILCGHTHKPTLGTLTSPYFNCGSCIHPNGITCIELDGTQATLVKWHICVKSDKCNNGRSYPLYICREVLEDTFY